MEPPRGRRTVIIAAVAAAAVAGAFGIAGKDLLLERWWIWRLGSEDPAVFRVALDRLGDLRSRRAIPALVEALGREDEATPNVTRALFRIGSPAVAEAIAAGKDDLLDWIAIEFPNYTAPVFRECLGDPRPSVRVRSLHRLLDQDGALLVPTSTLRSIAVEGLRSESGELRRLTLECLVHAAERRLRFAVPALAAVLSDPDPESSAMASNALAWSDDPRSIAILGGALGKADPGLRIQLLGSLDHLREVGEPADWDGAVPGLLSAIAAAEPRDPEGGWSMAVGLLGRAGAASGLAAPDLVKLLGSDDPSIAAAAFAALEEIGPRAAGTVPELVRRLGTGEDQVLRVLGAIGPGAAGAVPAIHAIAVGPAAEPAVRVAAATALARIAPEDPRALEAWRLAKDEAEILDEADLAPLGPLARSRPELIPFLAGFLDADDPFLRSGAARALGEAGPPARSALPALRRYLESGPVDAYRAEALRAIGRIEGGSETLLEFLERAVDRSELDPGWVTGLLEEIGPAAVHLLVKALEEHRSPPREKRSLISAIGANGPDAIGAAPALIEDLKDPALCVAAADALARIGPAAAPALAGALGSEEDWIRYGAARALAGMGPGARPALGALLAAARDDGDEEVRALAARAVAAIRGSDR